MKSSEYSENIEFLNFADIKLLLSSFDSLRDEIILKCLYETGCSVHEFVNIKVDAIDFKSLSISFPGRTSRISKTLADRIHYYLLQQDRVDHKTSYLISTRQSNQITTKRVRQIVQNYANKKGLGKKNPQVLRYTHIIHAFLKGIPQYLIQQQTGITESRMIQIFSHIKLDHDEKIYNKFFQ